MEVLTERLPIHKKMCTIMLEKEFVKKIMIKLQIIIIREMYYYILLMKTEIRHVKI